MEQGQFSTGYNGFFYGTTRHTGNIYINSFSLFSGTLLYLWNYGRIAVFAWTVTKMTDKLSKLQINFQIIYQITDLLNYGSTILNSIQKFTSSKVKGVRDLWQYQQLLWLILKWKMKNKVLPSTLRH